MAFIGFLNRVPGVRVPPGTPEKTKPRKDLRGLVLEEETLKISFGGNCYVLFTFECVS
jgi:hypothetical protein